MPSMPFGLPRSVMTWVSQVSVSVGATLIATMIYGALPKVVVPQFEPLPEMTSGGKFAARALPPVVLQAFDGLDTMPLPHVAIPGPVLPVDFVTSSAQVDAAVAPTAGLPSAGPPAAGLPAAGGPAAGTMRRIGDGGPIERSVKAVKALHPPLRADAKRPVRLMIAQAASEPVAQVLADEPATRAEDGWLPKAMSSARTAWSVTTSASDSLLAHVIPQLP